MAVLIEVFSRLLGWRRSVVVDARQIGTLTTISLLTISSAARAVSDQ